MRDLLLDFEKKKKTFKYHFYHIVFVSIQYTTSAFGGVIGYRVSIK